MNKSGNKRLVVKVVIIGDIGVGKTSLMQKYVSKAFSTAYKPTIGADFSTKTVTVDGMEVSMQMWDTAGQEKQRSIGNSYYRGADCCLLVYDVTSAESFRSLNGWRDRFYAMSNLANPNNFPFVVFGNKTDLSDQQVSAKQADFWCQQFGNIPHFSVSAKDSSNVEDAFFAVAQQAARHANLSYMQEDITASTPQMLDQPPRKSCCS